MGKGEVVRHSDTLVSQNNGPACNQGSAEGSREGAKIGYESGTEEDIPGEVYLVIENFLSSCCPSALSRPRGMSTQNITRPKARNSG